jgi:uncharacterized membrane protein
VEHSNHKLIEKHLKRAEDAGASANALGWIGLAISIGYVWLLNNPDDVYGLCIASIILGYYFIKTGKYIKNFSGRHMKLFLWLNGFVSLLLARGIIPLIVSVQSFMGVYSLGKVDRIDSTISVKSKPSALSTKERLIFFTLVIASLASAYLRAKNLV